MFSLLNDWVESAADAVKSVSSKGIDVVRQTGVLDALESVSVNPDSAAAAAAPQEKTLSVPDIMAPPATWAGSKEEWVWCVEAALRDPNTCALTPATLRADASLWEEMKTTVAHLLEAPPPPGKNDLSAPTPTGNSTEAPAALAAKLLERTGDAYTPAADLVKYIQEHYEVYQVRSYIVPRFTSDEDYWLNIGWRINLYRQCTNAGQLLTLMQTLSRLPQPLHDIAAAARKPEAPKSEAVGSAQHEGGGDARQNDDVDEDFEEEVIHLKDNAKYWHNTCMQYEVIQEKFVWLQETEERVRKEIELAGGNVKLLSSLIQRKEASTALGASVFDSCQYHKVKLSRLIADICAAPAEHSEGTLLDSHSGTLFHALVKCNDYVKAVLEAYADRPPSGSGSPKGVVSSPTSAAPASARQDSPAQCEEPSTEVGTGGSSPVELRLSASGSSLDPDSNKADGSDEEPFEAKLPWSMDD
ncbi:conserved hypothetical protein [Leishmania infantum JPCM5]|uniref:Uncharacterized protein n=2 Tax=Leishmania infantum TaxID=5671 RepID=A4I5W6_LEIIN|nr:conserved hypothetical protein [Leishmania infantum JPCM5]CAC9515284.1 hypothetical_protein_-_conserved [Leishmania infantum]CAM70188.1 conserved hypothetical protein [Leishmania infantum JPCM5]SUZ44107.1 hypothetical_protein_-_conserved [Leishmania infantum]|eukprot:XP_001467135.1 conserved hypothetical protein [Leishmania infantum JPCM5]